MYSINSDFKRVKIGYELNIIILIYQLLIPFIFILDIILDSCFKINILKKNGEQPSKNTVSPFHMINATSIISNNIGIPNFLEIRRLNEEIARIHDNYEKKINEQEVIINEGMTKIDKLNEKLKEKNKLNENLKKENEKNLKLIDEKNEEIRVLKSKVDKNENPGEKVDIKEVMVLNFTSQDQSVQLGIKCMPKELFADVEKRLYEIYSELKETNNTFLGEGNLIFRFKTIEENKIHDGAKIMLNIPE